jgi:hypothetical protein
VQAKRGPEFYMQQQRVERQGIGYLGISMLFQEAFIDSDAKRITLMDRAHFSTHNGSAKSSISNSLHAEISFQKLIDRAHFSTHNGRAKSRDRAQRTMEARRIARIFQRTMEARSHLFPTAYMRR